MKAISLWQPWASLIATGAKTIETRSWPTKYRGPLAIHAAKADNQEIRSMMHFWHVQAGLSPLKGIPLNLEEQNWSGVDFEELPRGAIIVVCELVDCIRTDDLTLSQIGTDKPFGDFSLGRYGWILKNVKPLAKPIFCKGMQGLWEYKGVIDDA